jgi:putative spermidine/putrescine transport system permease protein
MTPPECRHPRRPPASRLNTVFGVAGCLVGLFLVLPIFVVIPISFSGSSFLEFPPRSLSLRWYHEYFSSHTWIDSTVNSVKVALLTSVLATLVGTAAALAMQRARFRFRSVLTGLILSPMILPHIVLAISIYAVFARLKLIGSIWGLAAVYTMLATPFVYLNVSAALQALEPALEQAAMSLGATRWRALWHVTLPLIRPGITSGALLAMILAFDEVVIALFITGTTAVTLPKTMWDGIRTEINPTIAAVSSFLIVGYVGLLAAASAVRARALARRWGHGTADD